MSNRRRPAAHNPYRDSFLRSSAWFARRERWFRRHPDASCAACDLPGTVQSLELHHLDYTGVTCIDGQWQAWEADQDLVAFCPGCHEQLHRLIDRDYVLTHLRTRRTATEIALDSLTHLRKVGS